MKVLRSISFLLLLLPAFGLRAELTIHITEGVEGVNALAIVPFSEQGIALNGEVNQILTADLQSSGEFRLLSPNRMLSQPVMPAELRQSARDWRLLGQDYVLAGRVISCTRDRRCGNRKNLLVEFSLYDVPGERFLIEKATIEGPQKELRRIVHVISDKVFEKITGIRGVFSTRIVYVTVNTVNDGKNEYRLQMADADGQQERVLLTSRFPILSPAWSPDGKKVAYVSLQDGRPAIYIQTLATGNRKKVSASRGLNGAPAWSPDGRRLALTLSRDGNAEIYVMDLASGNLQRMTNHFAIDTEPAWSPDGKTLFFTSDRGGKPQIYRLDVRSKAVKRVTFEGKYNGRPAVSQDGKVLYFVHQGQTGFQIAAQELKSGSLAVLTDSLLGESPSISPNGEMIIYAAKRDNKGVLAVVTANGREAYFLPYAYGDVREPAWSPFLQ